MRKFKIRKYSPLWYGVNASKVLVGMLCLVTIVMLPFMLSPQM